MKKILSFTLTAGVLFLMGCTKSGLTTTITTTGNVITTGQNAIVRQTYLSKKDDFSIQYPSNRTFQENVFESSVMFFTPLIGTDTVRENIGIMKKTLDKEYTLDEYYKITKPELVKIIPGFTEVSNESIKINDIDAQKLIYTGTDTQGKTKLQWEQVYLIKNKAVYIITYTAIEDTFNEYTQMVDEMVATLEIK